MRAELVYVFHNCFGLKLPGRTLIFDPPEPKHLSDEAGLALEKLCRGPGLSFIISHSHGDHFDPGLAKRWPGASFIASYDVAELYPGSLGQNSLILEPDEQGELEGIQALAFESNDLGLAFLLSMEGFTLYYGGDLADWSWPGAPLAANRASLEHFTATLEQAAGYKPYLAFSNLDPRLPGLAGASLALEILKPGLFVPMHLFGQTQGLAELTAQVSRPGTRIFIYRDPGDSLAFEPSQG